MRRIAPLAAALALTLAAPAGAWDDPRFLTPRSATDATRGPDVAVDDAGRALATWMQTSNPASSTQWQVRAATAAPGASTWTMTPPLSPLGARAGNTALGVAGGGAAIAAWTQGANGVLNAVRGSTSGGFGDPTPLGGFGCPNNPNLTDDIVVGPVVALDDAGRGHVAWTAPCGDTTNGRWMLFRHVTPDGFATQTQSAGKSGSPTAVGPQLADDPASDGSRALFKHAQFPSPLVTRDLVGNQAVGSQTTAVADSGADSERLGFLPDGKQVIVYRTGDEIRALVDGVNTRLTPEGQSGLGPQLAVSADGTVVATWFAEGGFWAAVRHPVAGAWGPAHPLSETDGDPRDLDLAIADDGTAYAVWRRSAGDYVDIEGSILDPDDPTRSPGTPYQFQPVAETIFEAGAETLDGGGFSGDARTPKVTATPNGALAVFDFIIDVDGPGRHAVGSVRHTRTPLPPPPVDDEPPPPPGDPGTPAAGPPPPPPVVERDMRAPLLTAFELTRRTFAKGSKEGKIVGRIDDKLATGGKLRQPLRVGTRLRWTADEPGTAALIVTHTGCFSSSYVGDDVTKKERCPRRKDGVVFTQEVPSRRGGNTLKYVGKTLPGKTLRIGGMYRFSLVVTDAAGNGSRPRRVTARVDEVAG